MGMIYLIKIPNRKFHIIIIVLYVRMSATMLSPQTSSAYQALTKPYTTNILLKI